MRTLIMLFILIVAMICLICWKAWKKRRSRLDALLKKVSEARYKRIRWKMCHPYLFDFYHYEYQQLWDIQIGAELVYIHNGGCTFFVSWADYCQEREEAERTKI